eukprot:s551_g8.t1
MLEPFGESDHCHQLGTSAIKKMISTPSAITCHHDMSGISKHLLYRHSLIQGNEVRSFGGRRLSVHSSVLGA